MDFHAGDVGYVPRTLPHYVENTGDIDLKFLEMFKSDRFQDLSLSEWLTHTPPELVMAHLNLDEETLRSIPKRSARGRRVRGSRAARSFFPTPQKSPPSAKTRAEGWGNQQGKA